MKILKYITLAVLPLMFVACDNFAENEYVIYPEGETSEQTPITKKQNEQAILLEDYTGWSCVNCPAAAELVTDLQNEFGEKLVAMAVHAGAFARPSSANGNMDFRTEYGEKWYNDFGITSNPIGVINRKSNGTSSSKGILKDDWRSTIVSLLSSTKHTMNINLGATKRDNKFLVSVNGEILQDINQPVLITILVLEDGIIGTQLTNNAENPMVKDYVFNHVLRTNGLVDYSFFTSASANQNINKNYEINIDSSWNTANCKIVVFATNADNGEVLQVNEIDIE